MVGRDGDAELPGVVLGQDFAEGGQAEGGAVVALVFLDGADAGGPGVLGGREGAVADLEFDDVLALRLQPPGDGEDVERGLGGEGAGKGGEVRRHRSVAEFQPRRGGMK